MEYFFPGGFSFLLSVILLLVMGTAECKSRVYQYSMRRNMSNSDP